MNFARLRLQKHFGHAGCTRRISVEREDVALGSGNPSARVRKQRILRGVCEQPDEMLVRILPVEEAGIEVRNVRATPLGVFPVGLADAALDGDARGLCEGRRC